MKKFFALSLACALLFLSCQKEDDGVQLVSQSFKSSLEEPVPDTDENGDMFDQYAKNYLAMERYVYWDDDDTVSVFAGVGSATTPIYPNYSSQVMDVTVSVRSNQRYADINCHGIDETTPYYGIFPARSRVGGDPTKINFLTKYTYRSNNSFPKPGIPMVAYDGRSTSDAPALDFHSLCGLVRIQITASANHTVSAVSFTEVGARAGGNTQPISGLFDIQDITTYTPYVKPASTNTAAQTKVYFNDINQQIGPGQILTLYLPLPALLGSGIPSDDQYYYIGMAVKDDADKVFKKVFHVKVRRNTMSFLRAITITDWTGNVTTQGLVGEGTEAKPFQIYSADDMEVVRNAFLDAANTNSDPTINGIVITANTVFRVVRSTIDLNTSNWTAGIPNFKGKFTYETASNQVGITNTSGAPIFASISSEGTVSNLAVKGTNTYNGSTNFSPFCGTNSGTIENCHNLTTVTSGASGLAGICVTNSGTINNCSNKANLSSSNGGYVGGVCYENTSAGIISNCWQQSNVSLSGTRIGGLCYSNAGTITNSQVAYASNSTGITSPCGGILYENTGTVSGCQVLGTIYSSSQDGIGGICFDNKGLIDNCRNGISFLRGYKWIGGIAATQTSNSAEIRNCYNSSSSNSDLEGLGSTGTYIGGIVARLDAGKIYNCRCDSQVQSSMAEYYGVIVGYATLGDIQNCLDASGTAPFYGYAASGIIGPDCYTSDNQTDVCKYDFNTGVITSATANSYGYPFVNSHGLVYQGLNAWVSHAGNSYSTWTEQFPTSLTSSSGSSK